MRAYIYIYIYIYACFMCVCECVYRRGNIFFPSKDKISYEYITIFRSVSWICRKRRLQLCRRVKSSLATRPPVARGWRPIVVELGILVVGQSVIRQPKWSGDLQHFTLSLGGQDGRSVGRSKRLDPINP